MRHKTTMNLKRGRYNFDLCEKPTTLLFGVFRYSEIESLQPSRFGERVFQLQ